MQIRPPSPSDPYVPQGWNPGAGIWGLIFTCILVEIILLGADIGLWGTGRWRTIVIQNGAFWSGLLFDWRPNYTAQPATMFVTYAVLHASLGHLSGNMIALYVLGLYMQPRLRLTRLLLLYAASALGGAAVFAALNQSPFPMVGASGVIFGVLGALVAWHARARLRAGLGVGRTLRDVALIAGFNLLVWYWLEGLMAWEAHLGGFVTGAVMMWVWTAKPPGQPVR